LPATEPDGEATYISTSSDALYYHEIEKENLIKSGREWYQPVSQLQGITINPGFHDLITSELIRFRIRVLGRAPVQTLFRFNEGARLIQSLLVQPVNMFNTTGTYAQVSDSSGFTLPSSASPVFEISFHGNGDPSARGWLDFVMIHGRKMNTFNGITSWYSDSRSVLTGRITEFRFTSNTGNEIIWDITEPDAPRVVQYSRAGNNLTFKAETNITRSYLLFQGNAFPSPIIQGRVPSQDLHGSAAADMIIVTHPLFRNHARELAEMHLEKSGLLSMVVTPGEIYNEFSGGIPDISAIRNFLAMKYMKQAGTNHPLKYLLLFGDGSYENKTMPPGNTNFIPTYQSRNSNVIVSSFTSDDFYGLLESGEGEASGTEDIGIGRLPVSDTSQAGIVVRKIQRYLGAANTGEWKNVICIVADDEDANSHMADAENLALQIEENEPAFSVDKIYLDAFRQVTTVNGQSYPDVTAAINNRVNSGCLIFNYVGHGNENGLAHERVVKTENINSWKNGAKLPLFITATCEFSRFDDIDMNIATREMTGRPSAGEMVLLNEKGGGIALMSTTRVVYSSPNFFLNKNIYSAAFGFDTTGYPLRLGDIIRLAKNNSGDGSNKRNFSLLGDPALVLARPWNGRVITDSINHQPVTAGTDSLKALSEVTVAGHVEDNTGRLMNDFNGIVSPVVFDKSATIKTLANDGGITMDFTLRNSVLFSGKATASDGRFSFTFIVPRDINYAYGSGKIGYYAYENMKDMNGCYTGIIVGGFARVSTSDTAGPMIRLFMNDTLFRNGGITDRNPGLLALVEDEGGINTTGSGIGHDITAYLDNDPNRSFVLNNYFVNELDSYTRGTIEYDLFDLAKGTHSLTLKAWDNYNNSSEETIIFVVETDNKFILRNLTNYPNPFSGETLISAQHNRPDTEMEIEIIIHDLSGRTIRILKANVTPAGYMLPPVTWDGNTASGKRAGRGIYLYRYSVRTREGEKTWISGRMIIL
jgi:hypothetical protein